MADITAWSEENVSLSALAARQYQPSNGIDVPDRTNVNTLSLASAATHNGVLRLTFFTPTRTLTVSNITMLCVTGAVDTGGTTVRKMGLFTVNSAYTQITGVARTAHDPNLFQTSNLEYSKQFTTETGYSNSYTLRAGTTYAVGMLLYNTGGTYNGPTIVSLNTNSAVVGSTQTHLPMLVGAVTGQTDITNATLNVSNQSTANGIYARLT